MLSLLHVILKHMDQVIKNQQKTSVIVILLTYLLDVRYLVESATGVYTGSVFHDRRIEKEGHHGEFRYLVLGCVADTWYLVLASHHGEFR